MESEQKSKQFCSVCKEWLDMEVVPTGDGDDDGVIWYRCPQCQGFLPKLSASGGDDTASDAAVDSTAEAADEDPVDGKGPVGPAPASAAEAGTGSGVDSGIGIDDDLPFDSPAEMMAAEQAAREAGEVLVGEKAADPVPSLDDLAADAPATDESGPAGKKEEPQEEAEPVEPIAEYAARLEAALSELPADEAGGKPYRPWEVYELEQCIQHLAWDDCGIVVGKESLPGGRKVIKVFFQEAGVVRLIEQAPQ